MKKKIWSVFKKVLIVLVVAGIVWALFIRPKSFVNNVRKVEVKSIVVTKNVSSSGSVTSVNSADLSFGAAGKILRIYAAEGDVVKAGQTLAVLDSSSARQTVQSYKDLRDIALRDRDLFLMDSNKPTTAAGGPAHYAETLRQYDEKVSQAEAAYQAQLALLRNYTISAPFEGIITQVSKKQGENAAFGESIAALNDLSKLQFEVELDQSDYGLVKIGMPVDIKLNSYDGYVIKGVVTTLPLYAQADTKNFKVKIGFVADDQHPVRLGMDGDAYIVLATTNTAVTALTVDDIFFDNEDKPFVWIVRDTKLKKLPIETGLEGDIYTEVKTPLTETVVAPIKQDDVLTEGFIAKIL